MTLYFVTLAVEEAIYSVQVFIEEVPKEINKENQFTIKCRMEYTR